jgi:hypothetical protein
MSVSAVPRTPSHHRAHPRGEWVLDEAVYVCDGVRGWVIPAGTRWDYASVPRVGRLLMESTDLGCIASAAHDYAYRRGGKVGAHIRYTRAGADRLFLRLMAWEKVPWFRRWPAYLAVRAGGWTAWKNSEPERKAAA